MHVKITLQGVHARFNVDQVAIPLHQPKRFTFTIKGLPSFWSREYAKDLIVKAMRRQGYVHIDAYPTHATLTKWNCKVTFYVV